MVQLINGVVLELGYYIVKVSSSIKVSLAAWLEWYLS